LNWIQFHHRYGRIKVIQVKEDFSSLWLELLSQDANFTIGDEGVWGIL
jgi:hypothetical protein